MTNPGEATTGAHVTDAPPVGGETVLSVVDLVKHYATRGGSFLNRSRGTIHAVCGISFDLNRGETLGLVGESGCGKTTTGRAVLQLIPVTSGSVTFKGQELVGLDHRLLRAVRKSMQVVFQDPFASLDPRMPVGQSIAEPLHIHGEWSKSTGPSRVAEVLRLVGLDPRFTNRFPNEFSGGQRQRVGIARALILEPEMLVLDEPVSALDVSIQAGVVNLLEELQERLGISYLFIAHDLSVVRHISQRVAVMYLGRIVEIGTQSEIYHRPEHPYTQALLSAVPVPDPRKERSRQHIVLEGDVPSPEHPPSGCRFRTRCWKAQEICASAVPELVDRGSGHPVACFFPEPLEVV
jgi:peptide/nickel transport system ATP-binding protein/oligopeptide transport system ATP-binding protein